jgi:hypothetical protein
VSAAHRIQPSEIDAILGSLRDRGEQTLRGRNGLVRIWTWADLS